MRAYKFLAHFCYFASNPRLAAACCWLVSFCPFEEIQPLSKAELCLAAHRAFSLCISGLSDRHQYDCFEYQGIRCLLSGLALDLRTATGTAHFRVAVLH